MSSAAKDFVQQLLQTPMKQTLIKLFKRKIKNFFNWHKSIGSGIRKKYAHIGVRIWVRKWDSLSIELSCSFRFLLVFNQPLLFLFETCRTAIYSAKTMVRRMNDNQQNNGQVKCKRLHGKMPTTSFLRITSFLLFLLSIFHLFLITQSVCVCASFCTCTILCQKFIFLFAVNCFNAFGEDIPSI